MPRSFFSPCREGRGCTPHSCVSACREGKSYTPRSFVSRCCGDTGCTPCTCLSASHAGTVSFPSRSVGCLADLHLRAPRCARDTRSEECRSFEVTLRTKSDRSTKKKSTKWTQTKKHGSVPTSTHPNAHASRPASASNRLSNGTYLSPPETSHTRERIVRADLRFRPSRARFESESSYLKRHRRFRETDVNRDKTSNPPWNGTDVSRCWARGVSAPRHW